MMSPSSKEPPPMSGEPWLVKLRQGETEAAWDLLIERYHRLIAATVRHFVEGYDEVMDLFAYVCESLRADDPARLRKYAGLPEGRVRFSTWLVAVVRNLVIDWFRHLNGRKRLSKLVQELPPAQRAAFEKVYVGGLSPREAYDSVLSVASGPHANNSPASGTSAIMTKLFLPMWPPSSGHTSVCGSNPNASYTGSNASPRLEK
jgi:DNA-directed RNA polymerase specialized sigma24 family protein